MKKKAKYLGIPCFYDEDERRIIGRNPISSFLLWIAIFIDNGISWVYWKLTGKNRQGTITMETEGRWFPWEPVFAWLMALLAYSYFGGKLLLIMFMVIFFICVFEILMYILSGWTK